MLDMYGCRMGHLDCECAEKEEQKYASSTFALRLLLSLLIFGGFLWMHMEKRMVFGYQPEKVVEAISQNTDLQAFPKSVRIEKEERQAESTKGETHGAENIEEGD